MPPSPRIKATLDEHMFEQVCTQLNILPPTIKFKNGERAGKKAWGDYNRTTNHINLYLGVSSYEYDALRFAQTEAVRTMLHELRHAWQQQHRPDMYDSTIAVETDAEGWAQEQVASWVNLVRLSRSFPNSGFSRLGRHTRRVV